MRAARLFGPADLRVVDAPVPRPGKGQVLVRVIAYSPYGTDVGTYLNRHGRYVSSYPVGIGADFSGVVESCGAEVTSVNPGDRVTALALDHCGDCANCVSGRTNLCLDPEFAAPPRQICCEEFVLVSARKLAALPDEVTFEDGAMLAGIVDALNAYEQMELSAGDCVAVIGVGAMGLSAIAAGRALGIEVVALGGTGKRVEIARQLGAVAFGISAHGEDLAALVLKDGPGASPAIIETTATDWGIAQAFAIAAPGGIVALTGGGQLPLTSWDVVNRELRIVGVRCGHHQNQALDLIACGKIDLKGTVTRRYPLEEVADAFALLAGEGARDVGRVIIQIGDA
nr:alcohol dehydrogenase catalytic domain-containing protein [Novosphingobium kunmingense]